MPESIIEGSPLARCYKMHTKSMRGSGWQDARKHTYSRGRPVRKIFENIENQEREDH